MGVSDPRVTWLGHAFSLSLSLQLWRNLHVGFTNTLTHKIWRFIEFGAGGDVTVSRDWCEPRLFFGRFCRIALHVMDYLIRVFFLLSLCLEIFFCFRRIALKVIRFYSLGAVWIWCRAVTSWHHVTGANHTSRGRFVIEFGIGCDWCSAARSQLKRFHASWCGSLGMTSLGHVIHPRHAFISGTILGTSGQSIRSIMWCWTRHQAMVTASDDIESESGRNRVAARLDCHCNSPSNSLDLFSLPQKGFIFTFLYK